MTRATFVIAARSASRSLAGTAASPIFKYSAVPAGSALKCARLFACKSTSTATSSFSGRRPVAC